MGRGTSYYSISEKSSHLCHCEGRSRCEAQPKQTRSGLPRPGSEQAPQSRCRMTRKSWVMIYAVNYKEVMNMAEGEIRTMDKERAPRLGFIISILGAIILILIGLLVYWFDPVGIINPLLGGLAIVGAALAHYKRLGLPGGLIILAASAGSIPLIVINLGEMSAVFVILAALGGVLILIGR